MRMGRPLREVVLWYTRVCLTCGRLARIPEHLQKSSSPFCRPLGLSLGGEAAQCLYATRRAISSNSNICSQSHMPIMIQGNRQRRRDGLTKHKYANTFAKEIAVPEAEAYLQVGYGARAWIK